MGTLQSILKKSVLQGGICAALFFNIPFNSLPAATLSGEPVTATEYIDGREAVAGEVLIAFRAVTGQASRSNRLRVAALRGAAGKLGIPVTSVTPVGTGGVYRLRATQRSADLLAVVRQMEEVAFVEPNFIVHASELPDSQLPEDPRFSEQWGLRNTGQWVPGLGYGTAGADISAVPAWAAAPARSVVVGILDTGVDCSHPDIACWTAPEEFSVWVDGEEVTCPAGSQGFNVLNRSCEAGAAADDHGHGTHVAGIIGAKANGVGVVGVAPGGLVLPLKMLDQNGAGTMAGAIALIDAAVQLKLQFGDRAAVSVMNASWGGPTFSAALKFELQWANGQGLLFVAAAGNQGVDIDRSPVYPASYDLPGVIGVSASNNLDELAGFSNFGRGVLAAPGAAILSTLPGGAYAYWSGTSMATPFVSGAAALILGNCPVGANRVRPLLLESADRVAAGMRLNLARALSWCQAPPAQSDGPPVDDGAWPTVPSRPR